MPTVYRQIVPCCVFAGLLAAVLGCDTSSQFAADELLLASNRIVPAHRTACEELLADQFGTPDEPRIPASLDDMFDAQLLELAAGEVISHTEGVTHGLYRRHCARCHGVTGDGRGPTALYQHPYPRDYRRGVFKYKSTQRGAPPTDADLHGVLERGVAGTAMPSFALLAQQERDALVQYVKYLAIRGQAERALVDYVAEELEFDPQTGEVEAGSELSASSPDDQELVAEIVADVADRWRSA
ncbi:MAG: cytochrome c, partial [Planctomycetota bacterium]